MTAPARVAAPAHQLAVAVRAAVEARGLPFGDGKRPATTGTGPFVVGWFDAGTHHARSLLGGDGWYCTLIAQCAGLTVESSRVAVGKLAAAILGLHQATVAGWTVQFPQQSPAPPMNVERDGDRDLYVHAVEWRLRLTPP